jgi:hypothetical protein
MADLLYSERISSKTTTLLFVFLAMVFFVLFGWRFSVVSFKFVPGLFVFLGIFFIFYMINYLALKISITDEALQLKFGLIGWRTDINNIKQSVLYDPPFWIKYGGAGVHFALVDGEYLAFYNFLEYPRVLIRFRKKQGLVQTLVFSTRQSNQIIDNIQEYLPRT